MRWSIEELITSMRLYRTEGNIFYRILISPIILWRRFKVFIFWLFKGYTKEKLWDLGEHILEEVYYFLPIFMEQDPYRYPSTYRSPREWREYIENFLIKLGKMIDEEYIREILEYDEITKEILYKYIDKQHENDQEVLKKLAEILPYLWD